jgi:hypothetical protein
LECLEKRFHTTLFLQKKTKNAIIDMKKNNGTSELLLEKGYFVGA